MKKLLCAVVAMTAVIGEAANAKTSDGFVLGYVLNGRSSQESTKQVLYKLTKLQVADDLYKQDKAAAIRLVAGEVGAPKGKFPGELPPGFKAFTETYFLKEYSKLLDDEIKGVKLGDVSAGKLIKLAASS